MFPELIQKGRTVFHESFDKWEDAIIASCQPLLKEGTIEQSYINLIIDHVNELGPYIVIAPNICIPHAQEGAGVHDTAVSFMKTQKPVHFSDDPDQDACLFFVLASVDNDVHMDNLNALVELLADEAVMETLLSAKSDSDLAKLP